MSVQQQVHAKFKLFAGELGGDLSLGPIGKAVEDFVAKTPCAPKSIGVEYLEGEGRLVLSLGYRDDEPAYNVRLSSVSIGTATKLDSAELTRLDQAMEAAASKVSGILCHELFVTEKREFVMVFMTHVSK